MFMDYDDTRNFAESVLLAIILNYTPEEMVDVYHNFFGGKYDKPVNKIVMHGITAVYNHEKKCWEKEKKMKTVRQARQEAYKELFKPEYKEIRNEMLKDILKIVDERLEQLEEENGTRNTDS